MHVNLNANLDSHLNFWGKRKLDLCLMDPEYWCACKVHASVQVAEGLAKPLPFPCSCGLTRRKIKERGLTTTPLALHFTARQKPIPPSPRSEREKRGQRSPPPQPPLTDNEENTAGRREVRWRTGGERMRRHEVLLPGDGEV